MAKAKTAARKATIKGATKADKEQIAAARAVNKAEAAGERAPEENTKTGVATPEAAPTPREARDAAQKLFDKADEDGKAAIIAETQVGLAARGY